MILIHVTNEEFISSDMYIYAGSCIEKQKILLYLKFSFHSYNILNINDNNIQILYNIMQSLIFTAKPK